MKQPILFLCFLFGFFSGFAQLALPPAQPSGFTASQVNLENKISASWSAPQGVFDGYYIYYKAQSSATTDSLQVLKPAVTATISSLTTNTIYDLQIRTYKTVADTVIVGTDTTITNRKLFSIKTPAVPLRVTVASLVAPTLRIEPSGTTHNKIIVEITDTNAYETGFEVELSENGFTKLVTINTSGNSLLETITTLKPKTQYNVRVRAVKDGNFGPYSDIKSETTLMDVPPPAVIELGGNCPLNVAIKWNISTRIDEVEQVYIQRSQDNVTFVEIGEAYPHASPFIDNGALPGIKYYYLVHTKNVSGRTNSNLLTVHVPGYGAPNAPYNIISHQDSKTTTSLTISWTKGAEENVCKTNILGGTELAIKVNGGEMKTIASLSPWENMYKIENLKPKDEVEILLRAHSDKGIAGGWVSIKDVTYGPSSKPSDFIAVLIKDNIGRRVLSLGWKDNSKDEDYFEIHKSLDGINFYQHAIVFMDYTSLIDTEIDEGKNYYYKLRSVNWAGPSDFTNVIGPFNIDYSKLPNAPFGLILKRRGNGVDLSWVDDSINEKNYIVEKSSDSGSTFSVIGTLDMDVTTYRDENIIEGRTYIYRVKATNTVGSSPYSKPREINLLTASGTLGVTIFPNPISDLLNLKADGELIEKSFDLKIYDQGNRLVLDRKVTFDDSNSASISAGNLSQGVYNMTLGNGKELITKKLVKL